MSDYRLFDTFQDSILVLDEEARVVYGNVTVAFLLDVSAKRLTSKRPLSSFMTFSEDPIEAVGGIKNIVDATQMREMQFTAPTGKEGWIQVVILPQPSFFPREEGDASGRWIVYIRDVSLEKILHNKYRGELDQKEAVINDLKQARAKLEDYSKNLEQMVAARTAELSETNSLLKTILDSLGQGILVFGRDGNCLPVHSQICKKMFGVDPAGRPIDDVLVLSDTDKAAIGSWREAVFAEMLDFPDLVPLAPSRLAAPAPTEISLGYNAMRDSNGTIAGVVVVATDRTREMQAVREAQAERELVRRVVQVSRHRDAFRMFVSDARALLDKLGRGHVPERHELERQLHTLKGGAATFGLGDLASICHRLEDDLKTADLESPQFKAHLADQGVVLKKEFNAALEALSDLLGPQVAGNVAVIEVPLDAFKQWAEKLAQGAAQDPDAARSIGLEIRRTLLERPIGDALSHFEPSLIELAGRLGKKIAPVIIEGSETRVPFESWQSLLTSLVHAFRNSLDHGLEMPNDRLAAGKPEEGQLRAVVKRNSKAVTIEISDDGRGVNVERVREKLRQNGRAEWADRSDEEVCQAILLDDLSTAQEITDISGRGIGLGAIAAEAKKLGGSVRVHSVPGKGMSLKIELPLEEIGQRRAA